jgi:hypothetical protein
LGWQIFALREGAERVRVVDIQVPLAFQEKKNAPVEQLFFDLGLLEVEQKLPSRCELAAARHISAVERGMRVGCLRMPHDGEPLTRFDRCAAELVTAKVREVTQLPDASGPDGQPAVLHLQGKFPEHVLGSPVVNEDGRVLAVYAEKAQLPAELAQGGLEVHYAVSVDLVAAWLDGRGVQRWVSLKAK